MQDYKAHLYIRDPPQPPLPTPPTPLGPARPLSFPVFPLHSRVHLPGARGHKDKTPARSGGGAAGLSFTPVMTH